MFLSKILLGRFIPWRKTPGTLWHGKQRKLPRLTHSRKEAFLDYLLISQQNEELLNKPCITKEVEAATLEEERMNELKKEDQIFYDRYMVQFNKRFPTRKIESFWENLMKNRRFDV